MALKVIVTGACGKMGQEVVRTVVKQADMKLVGAIEKEISIGIDIGKITSAQDLGVAVTSDLKGVIEREKPDCLVDFTRGSEAPGTIMTALAFHLPCVVGTTGIRDQDIEEIGRKSLETGTPVLMAPNFSLGAVLMMKFAVIAARYYDYAEIIELHHEKKLDAPSGTALRTAQLMTELDKSFHSVPVAAEKLEHVRGGELKGIRIHSVRLPGLLAHQEVMLGGEGEMLTLRHDSTARSSFMPGVMMAIRKIDTVRGLAIGLENIME
jgi:4-hydroxy-tetrahydrodipicolinate reductase